MRKLARSIDWELVMVACFVVLQIAVAVLYGIQAWMNYVQCPTCY